MTRQIVNDPSAAAVGPYSHGVWAGELLFLSGQTPIDAATRTLVEGDVGTQTRQCLANLAAVLSQAGLGLGDAIKCNVYLVDMADFAAMNTAYRDAFGEPYPGADHRGRGRAAAGRARGDRTGRAPAAAGLSACIGVAVVRLAAAATPAERRGRGCPAPRVRDSGTAARCSRRPPVASSSPGRSAPSSTRCRHRGRRATGRCRWN